MATISNADLAVMRRLFRRTHPTLSGVDVPLLKLVFQGTEDWAVANFASFSAAIETIAPGKFSNPEKAQIFKVWAEWKFRS